MRFGENLSYIKSNDFVFISALNCDTSKIEAMPQMTKFTKIVSLIGFFNHK